MSSLYAGDPSNYPLDVVLPSDGDGSIEAADVNVGLEGIADRTENLRARAVDLRQARLSVVARNWSAGAIGFTISHIRGAAYMARTEPAASVWFAHIDDASNGYNLWVSVDDGRTWGSAGATSFNGTARGMAVDPATGTICIGCSTTTGISQYTGVWTIQHVAPSLVGPTLTTRNVVWFQGAGRFIAVGNATAGGGVYTHYTSYSVVGATWTEFTLASAVAPATDISYSFAQSATRLCLFGLTSKTAQGGASYSYATTDNGTAWTTRTIAAMAAADVLLGSSYDTVNGLFVVVTALNVVYTSPDGVTWTALGTAMPANIIDDTLRCIGDLWIAACAVFGGYTGVGFYSVDAGVTWKVAPIGLAGLATPTALVAGTHNFLVFSDAGFRVSSSL